MEGSAEDTGAPDTWEMADAEESMGRLMLLSSSQKKNPEFANESPSDSLPAAAAACGDGGVGSSGDAFFQVDLFLREALEKPRERLSSKFVAVKRFNLE
ncbi:uncharacterized protein M6B38_120770 [Iris pallida]|uniref:Uncharacterized protein n=1 Tax=Iris pallida TaxID=29817 RepID=A0AAX6HAL0_IRIPA|nr:uncharacterized protein M6B38_120770 [Iris pallida]